MMDENFQPKVAHVAALVAVTVSLLMSACGGPGNGPRSSKITAQRVCSTLSGKTVGGATLTTEMIPAGGAVPTYCKVKGTLAPALNFETACRTVGTASFIMPVAVATTA